MTYVVPSQGRDAEIQHMQEVETFFTDLKMNIDALWLNDQVGVSFNEIFQLGTGGQTSAGAFSIFPIMQPVSRAVSTMALNPRLILPLRVFRKCYEFEFDSVDEDYSVFVITHKYRGSECSIDPHTFTFAGHSGHI
jgi:hypothetical protein